MGHDSERFGVTHSRDRWRVPMLFVAGNKPPRESGNHILEKHGVAASGLRRTEDGVPFKKTRHGKNSHYPRERASLA